MGMLLLPSRLQGRTNMETTTRWGHFLVASGTKPSLGSPRWNPDLQGLPAETKATCACSHSAPDVPFKHSLSKGHPQPAGSWTVSIRFASTRFQSSSSTRRHSSPLVPQAVLRGHLGHLTGDVLQWQMAGTGGPSGSPSKLFPVAFLPR